MRNRPQRRAFTERESLNEFVSRRSGDESRQDARCDQEGHDQTQPGAGEDGGVRAGAEDLRGQRYQPLLIVYSPSLKEELLKCVFKKYIYD